MIKNYKQYLGVPIITVGMTFIAVTLCIFSGDSFSMSLPYLIGVLIGFILIAFILPRINPNNPKVFDTIIRIGGSTQK